MLRRVLISILLLFGGALTVSATCIANTPPTITVGVSGPDANDNYTFNISWTIHNTDPNATGVVDVGGFDINVPIYYNGQAPLTGSSGPITKSLACIKGGPHQILATVSGCGQTETYTSLTIPSTQVTFGFSNVTIDPVTATGTVTVNYNFPNSIPANDDVHVDGMCDFKPAQKSGTYVCNFSTECWPTGSRDITGTGSSCTGDFTTAKTTVSVNSKPTVTLTDNGPDQNGDELFTVGWTFPNTTSHLDRAVFVSHDGCCSDFFLNQGPATESGSQQFRVATSCWPAGKHTFTATAFANTCTNEGDVETSDIEIQGGTPTVQLRLVQNGQTLAGDPSYDAVVSWSFPTNTTLAERSVTLTCDTGNCPASIPSITPNPAASSQTVTIGALDTYTHFTATATSNHCGTPLTAKDTAGAGGCCPAGSAGTPVLVNTGSVQVDTTDPLPQQNVLHLTRAYDSDNHTQGLFGIGWTSLLDSKVTTSGSGANQVVVVWLESHQQYLFWSTGGRYAQLWPKGQQVTATLTGNTSTGFVFREGGGRTTRTYSGAGKLLKVTSLRERRDITVTYDGNGLPAAVADSWGTFSLTITTDSGSRLITNIRVSDTIAWTYQYSAAQLIAVLAPDVQAWRTYAYDGSGHLTDVRDALGNLIESHAYDAKGRGTNSLQVTDDVQSIALNQAGRVAGETLTQVTYTSGRVVNYYVRGTNGVLHTVEVRGGCSSCSASEDVTYTFDAFNHVIREQDGRGYVKESAYDVASGQLSSVTGPLQPSGCDPATDPAHCRMTTTDDLAAAMLVPTALTKTTTYAYGDPNWPDLPILITTTSVANPSATRSDAFGYDSVTGTALAHTETGWTSSTQSEAHTTSTALYNGSEGAAFDPGGPFSSSWLTLAQPAGLRKQIDGPRTDVSDVTTFVYYPIDPSVTPTWRGKLAAVRDALGHITTYSDYDVFGNAETARDSNHVAVTMAYDPLGRLLTSTYPAISGCDTVADPTCNTDIVDARSYSAGGGPLASETKPRGGVTSYTYDPRGRVASLTRTISSTVSERIEYDYDPNTGQRSADRFLDNSSGSFVTRKSVSYAYDSFGRLAQITYPDAAKVTYAYDAAGTLSTVQDENHQNPPDPGPNTFYSYNATGAVANVSQTLGGGLISTSYGYDVQGNLTSVTDPNGNLTTYTYDDFGRTTKQVSPVTGTTTYAYDLAGNLLTTTDANGATTTRAYDALSRPLFATSTLSGSPSETINWSYDEPSITYGIGRLTAVSDPTGATFFAYDHLGRLRYEYTTRGSAGYPSFYAYDTEGNRTSMTYPSGRIVTYTYDLAGRQISAASGGTSLASAGTYLPFGPL
ncbi:MAG TPA: DUF6531 domain-containing protein, partial [Thermoanaerobaculia bacterium]|nr:DUF6531 domain-containing protein [Thermoanaerobaculia bacterium]